jgi:hypothetical protein
MSEVVPLNNPTECGSNPRPAAPVSLDLGQLTLGCAANRALLSFEEALQCVAFHCPRGAIVVLEGIPQKARSATLTKLTNSVAHGKREWLVRDALRDVVTHSPARFPAADKVIIDGYIPKRGGIPREVVFQISVAKRCAGSPAYVLTEQWPDPATLGMVAPDPFTKFAWANGFFTSGAEVVFIRHRESERSFEAGKAVLISNHGSLYYSAPLPPMSPSGSK